MPFTFKHRWDRGALAESAYLPVGRALTAGLVGAAALTAAHELTRQFRRDAPRMDEVGERALARIVKRAGWKPPKGRALYGASLAGDLLTNGLYYGLMLRRPQGTWLRGTLAGALAGLGALSLPQMLGLGRARHTRKPSGQAMTIGIYTLGGLAAAGAMRLLWPRR